MGKQLLQRDVVVRKTVLGHDNQLSLCEADDDATC